MKDVRRKVRFRTYALALACGIGIGLPLIAFAAPPIPDLATKPEFDDSVPVTISADGSFAFPLLVTYEDIVAGLGGTDADSRWCYWLTHNCHHDYNAADILVPTGTPVVAPENGMVVKAGPNNGWRNMTVKLQVAPGRCDLFMHMLPDSLAVGVGENVAQGQLIGRVGTADDAINRRTGSGTIPHLHIERNNCDGGDKEDIQPALHTVFELLPHREDFLPKPTAPTTTTTAPPPAPPAPPVYPQLPPQPAPVATQPTPASADMSLASNTVTATVPVVTKPPPVPPPPPIYPQLPPMP